MARRATLARRLCAAGGGIALIPTAPARRRNGDSDHPYRFDSHFHHLTGHTESDAWLLLDGTGRSTLFCLPKDPDQETWHGFRLGPEAAPATLGVDAAWPVAELNDRLPELLNGQPAVWTPFGIHDGLAAQVDRWLDAVRSREGRGWVAPASHRDLGVLLNEMRLVKDVDEVAMMRRAGTISASAHARAMRFSAGRFRSGVSSLAEFEVEAELLHEFRREGSSGPAYTSIVAAGPNSCVLHHPAGSARLEPGQLCLVDAGCELDGYASDITRTWPADGRFSGAQRTLYELVLAAQTAALAVTRPGERLRAAHDAAVRVLSEGLLDLGLLDRQMVGDVDAVIESAAYRAFYMHGTGHWLGRDVHDVGDYLSQHEAPVEQPDGLGGRVVKKPSRMLEPGMVVTVEPGLYVRPAAHVPERFWNIGIRIEDDALITDTGHELLSRGVPVRADEIEALMRG